MTIYHYAMLSNLDLGLVRGPGPGLGNLLFPISRAVVGAEHYGGIFVYPTMRQVKIGTYLRRERDRRTYGDVLRPRTRTEWLHWLAAQLPPKVTESDFDGTRDATICYFGHGRHFHDLQGYDRIIRSWIETHAYGSISTNSGRYDIAMHVRLGDFADTTADHDGHNVKQPLDWYRTAYHKSCNLLGVPVGRPKVVLFTDGEPSQVAQELGIVNLEVDSSRNALQSILRMSKADMLIGSRSTFSMWAAFLGNVPTIWPAAFSVERTFPIRPGADIKL